ncbi:hypothetical protein LCGC14_3072570, partial [marine sediment metagenome]
NFTGTKNISDPKNLTEDEQDTLIKELLKLACDTSSLEGKKLSEKIDQILTVRVENELMINKLLQVGTVHDQISIENAAKINNRSKDSLSDLVKVKQLLEGLPTDRISVENEDNQFRMDRLADMRN